MKSNKTIHKQDTIDKLNSLQWCPMINSICVQGHVHAIVTAAILWGHSGSKHQGKQAYLSLQIGNGLIRMGGQRCLCKLALRAFKCDGHSIWSGLHKCFPTPVRCCQWRWWRWIPRWSRNIILPCHCWHWQCSGRRRRRCRHQIVDRFIQLEDACLGWFIWWIIIVATIINNVGTQVCTCCWRWRW